MEKKTLQEINDNILPYEKSKEFDYHIHIGQFYNEYYEPHKVIEVLSNNGIKGCWFSSLSTCLTWNNGNEKTYITKHIEDEVIEALETARKLDFDAKALYWVNLDEYLQVLENHIRDEKLIENIKSNNDVRLFLNDYLEERISNINYYGFKIHTRFNYWNIKNDKVILIFNVICEFAERNVMPILIHCGYDECDRPSRFLDWFIVHQKVLFILAHLRPAEDVIKIMKKCKNVWTDTAFASEESIKLAYKEGVGDRVLYGTDYPINKDVYI